MRKSRYYSYYIRGLPEGCKYCVQGRKLVLFVTGVCKRKCFYCSISDEKYQHDVVFANERPVHKDKDIIEEARINQAFGAGITGGDPLARLKRTVHYIKLLKKEFGKNFHIHLYTIPESIEIKTLKSLYEAGLDEIRVHPDLENKKFWPRIRLLKEFRWDYGIEIPAVPHLYKNTVELIKFSRAYIKFLNLNELEWADNGQSNFKGYHTKNSLSYAISGSEETALKLMKLCEKSEFRVHYCTAKLKDRVQLKNRIKLRAMSVKTRFDKVTSEGILIRNVVFASDIKSLKEGLNKAGIKDYIIDKDRALVAKDALKLLKRFNLKPAIVKEYPTYDRFPVEISYL